MKAAYRLYNMIKEEKEKWANTNNDVLKDIADVEKVLSYLLKAPTKRRFKILQNNMAKDGYELDMWSIEKCFIVKYDDKKWMHYRKNLPLYLFKAKVLKNNDSNKYRAKKLYEDIFQ